MSMIIVHQLSLVGRCTIEICDPLSITMNATGRIRLVSLHLMMQQGILCDALDTKLLSRQGKASDWSMLVTTSSSDVPVWQQRVVWSFS